MKRESREASGDGFSAEKSGPGSSMAAEKAKFWKGEEADSGGGMDELLAVLGYKVRSSDMADVAHKLEQLEMVLGSAQETGLSHLSDGTVHYNPSDLSGWVQSMLSELRDPNPDFDPTGDVQTRIFDDHSEYDLRAIPGSAACSRTDERGTKRAKTEPRTDHDSGESARPVVLIDSQETGVRLVHTLLACAEAVQDENFTVADALVKHVGLLAASQSGAMRKVATYFAEALARRIYRIYPRDCADPDFDDTLLMHFYESCPYLKFAHFTANQAILEAVSDSKRVHVIDLGLRRGLQWPALMQALALRPSGPPFFRLTGIGSDQDSGSDRLNQVGSKLAELARTLGLSFEFKGVAVNCLTDLTPELLEIRTGTECVAVNSIFELHSLLAWPGSIEKVFATIKAVRPDIVTVAEQEADHNGSVFLDRFTESLHYYSSLFDSLEGPPSQDRVMSELYLGKQILNVVACDGPDRVERHETLELWRNRLKASGFGPVHLGSNAYKQASMLLALSACGDGYQVEERDGCLMLGWHSRPVIATSAWRVLAAAAAAATAGSN